jgi:hypothetical protein
LRRPGGEGPGYLEKFWLNRALLAKDAGWTSAELV